MLEKTLLNALTTYRIQIQTGNRSHTQAEIDSILDRIGSCEEYIRQGNKVDGTWMAENHTFLSKAVKCAHDFIHRNYAKSDSEYLSEEHKELNRCVRFFADFYEKLGVDSKYMDIDF